MNIIFVILLDKNIKRESISYYFLSIWAEEIGRWCNLSGIYFCIWKFSKMCDDNFLFHGKKLIKIKPIFLSQFFYNFPIGLWLFQTIPILFWTNKSILRFIGLEYFPNHKYLLLREPLIKVKLHFKIRIYFNFLWLAWSHCPLINFKIRKWIIIFIFYYKLRIKKKVHYQNLNPSGNWNMLSARIGPFWFCS